MVPGALFTLLPPPPIDLKSDTYGCEHGRRHWRGGGGRGIGPHNVLDVSNIMSIHSIGVDRK